MEVLLVSICPSRMPEPRKLTSDSVYIAILVIECAVIYFYFVETKGPTLEEIAKLFDGEDAGVAGRDQVGEKSATHAIHEEKA